MFKKEFSKLISNTKSSDFGSWDHKSWKVLGKVIHSTSQLKRTQPKITLFVNLKSYTIFSRNVLNLEPKTLPIFVVIRCNPYNMIKGSDKIFHSLFSIKKCKCKFFWEREKEIFFRFFSKSLSVNTSTWHQIELVLKKKKKNSQRCHEWWNERTNLRKHKLS